MTLTEVEEMKGMVAEIIDDMEDWTYCNGYAPTESDLEYRQKRIQSIAHMIVYALLGTDFFDKETEND